MGMIVVPTELSKLIWWCTGERSDKEEEYLYGVICFYKKEEHMPSASARVQYLYR